MALFPQGGIDRDGISGGAVFMAVKGQAPLLPMHIRGAAKALPLKKYVPSLFTKITVSVDPPIRPSDLMGEDGSTSQAVDRGVAILARLFVPNTLGEKAVSPEA